MANEFDINGDGRMDDKEFTIYQRKVQTQRKIATTAIAAVVVFTAILMTPYVTIDRVQALSDVFSMFYITMSGIIAAYFGAAAWMGKK